VQISLRSHLIAGTAAVVGAGAIAINPVMGAQLSLPSINVPAVASVALAGFDSPLAQLFDTLNVGNQYLLNDTSSVTDAANWPYAGFGTTFGVPPTNYPLLPGALATNSLGGYSSVGVIPQIIDDALPIISQLGYNGLDYLNVTGDALFGAGSLFFQSLWTAGGQLLMLDIPGALATVYGAISASGSLLLGAGGYVLQNVIAKATAVLNTITGSLPLLIGATVAQASVLVAKTTQVITDSITALGGGNFQGAWNAAVDGLLGPSGLPGTLLNLTVGAGVQAGPIATPDAAGIAAVFVPSVRTEVQTLVKEITVDLQATPAAASAPAAAAKKVGRSAASVRSAAAVAAPAAEAPAAEAPAGDSAAAASSAPAEKPAAHREARGAAKRAAAAS